MADMQGSCLCGAVKYELTGDPMMSGYCHCTRCRRFTGAAAEAALVMPEDSLTVTQGQDQLQEYRSEGFATRVFCKTCGSSLFSHLAPMMPATVITMGTLDGEPVVKPMMHIQVAHMASWHTITDDLPQHAEMPG